LHELSRPKNSGRSPRNPKKYLPEGDLTTEGQHTSGKSSDRSRSARAVRKLVRLKIFGSKVGTAGFFPARKLKNRKIFRLKVEKSKKSWRESWKKGCEFGN
jgi:hypothetical protein